MNKKASFGIGFLMMIFVLICVVIVLSQAQSGVDTSTIDKAIDTLNWSRFGSNVTKNLEESAANSTETGRAILGIVGKAVDFIGYSIMEVSKLAMKLARDNPDIINYKVLLVLILLALIAPLIYPAFIIIVSLILIIRESVLNRREKKALKKNEM